METLLVLTYASVCWVIFKVFKIPVNKWTLTTVVLGGVVMLGTLLAGMAYFHPSSVTARSYYFTTPIVPNVRGKIIEVEVKMNKPLKKGDVLCRIDPVPFQAQVDRVMAQLTLAKQRLAESEELAAAKAGNKFDVERYQADVSDLEAQLERARFDLDSTIIRAPTDGFAMHVRVRPGMMAVPLPLAPIMTFVHSDESLFIAAFRQQPMQNIKPGNHAEVIFPGIPGRIFQARVVKVLDALAEGQLQPSGTMARFTPDLPQGLIPVVVEIEQDISEFFLPMGVSGTVAIYSERWHHVSPIRKILMRMKSWQNFAHFH